MNTMAKYLHLQIPKGCEESWDAMKQQQHGKFCNSCQNTVIDFTRMTDEQLIQFFKKGKDNVCGRFAAGQLNTDIPIPAKRIPWLRYFFQITIPAFLFSSKIIAQGKVKVQEHSRVSQTAKQDKKPLLSKSMKRVSGIEFDEKELANKISIKPEACQIKGDNYTTAEHENQKVTYRLGGAVSMVHRTITRFKSPTISINKAFTIFPNPIASSSELNIRWRNPVTANQTIEIYDESGFLLQKEIFFIAKTSTQENFNLQKLQPATYIIKVTDNKTHKSFSQQFIVQ